MSIRGDERKEDDEQDQVKKVDGQGKDRNENAMKDKEEERDTRRKTRMRGSGEDACRPNGSNAEEQETARRAKRDGERASGAAGRARRVEGQKKSGDLRGKGKIFPAQASFNP